MIGWPVQIFRRSMMRSVADRTIGLLATFLLLSSCEDTPTCPSDCKLCRMCGDRFERCIDYGCEDFAEHQYHPDESLDETLGAMSVPLLLTSASGRPAEWWVTGSRSRSTPGLRLGMRSTTLLVRRLESTAARSTCPPIHVPTTW
jgi:hypothetical protein